MGKNNKNKIKMRPTGGKVSGRGKGEGGGVS